MSRKRKTRRQKMLSDLRHHVSLSSDPTPSQETEVEAPVAASSRFQYTFSAAKTRSAKPQAQTVALQTYDYVSKDLFKTALVTGSIVIVELVLAYGLKSL
ncbi:MAG: hypothetical protein HY431_00885 [Candidatus Levybacteria bacterium]|nr:hypothetical protein [Candidatus Levybacteria bacterium]